MSDPRVIIVILNWNRRDETIQCIDSVNKLDYPNFQVIVIDNGSVDGSVPAIRSIYPQLLIIENSQNLGYTGGNNIGLKYALSHGADYLWLLNNDTIVEPTCLSRLISTAERSTDIALVSPLICNLEKPEIVTFRGERFDFTRHVTLPLGNNSPSGCYSAEHLFLWGTALLVRCEAVKRIGFLSDEFFAYHEDLDYSARSFMAGYRNVIEPSAKVYHKHPLPGTRPPYFFYYIVRNRYLFWKKHLRTYHKLTYLRYYIAGALRTAIDCRVTASPAHLDASLDGMWSGLFGIAGPRSSKGQMPTLFKKFLLFIICVLAKPAPPAASPSLSRRSISPTPQTSSAHPAPLVSVVIPTHNCAQYISEAIESLLKQTHPNVEIIVVDDESTDNTRDLLSPYIERGDIQYICQKRQGAGGARNTGIKAAAGQYIGFLDADDALTENSIEVRAQFLTRHPEVDVVFSDYFFQACESETKKRSERKKLRVVDFLNRVTKSHDRTINGVLLDRECSDVFLAAFLMWTGTVLARKDVFDRVGLFHADIVGASLEDTDMWWRVVRNCRLGYLNLPTAYYREFRGSAQRTWHLFYDQTLSILANFLKEPKQSRRVRRFVRHWASWIHYERGLTYEKRGKYLQARRDFLQSIRYNPWRRHFYKAFALSFLPPGVRDFLRKLRKLMAIPEA